MNHTNTKRVALHIVVVALSVLGVIAIASGHVFAGTETWSGSIPIGIEADTVILVFEAGYDSAAVEILEDTNFLSWSHEIYDNVRNYLWARYKVDGYWYSQWFLGPNPWVATGDSTYWKSRLYFGFSEPDTLYRQTWTDFALTATDTFYNVSDLIDSLWISDSTAAWYQFAAAWDGLPERVGFIVSHNSAGSGTAISVPPGNVSIYGWVIDKHGDAIHGAIVKASVEDCSNASSSDRIVADLAASDTTNALGFFSLSVIASDNYDKSACGKYLVTAHYGSATGPIFEVGSMYVTGSFNLADSLANRD